MKKIICGCLMATALSGCGLFDKDPLDIEGTRVSVIREDKNLKPDYVSKHVRVRLPKAKVNYLWSQSGMSSEHNGGHIKAGGNLNDVWDESFGEGSSKRNVLISTPVANSNAIFAIDAEGVVTAFDLATGDEIWEKELEHPNEEAHKASLTGGGLAVYKNKVYATTGFGIVFALDASDGNIIWQKDIGAPIRIAPTVGEELLIAQTLDNGIYAINLENGNILWKDKLAEEATTMIGGAAPAYSVEQDLIVAAFSNGQIQAYKASTGTPLWSEWLVSATSTESIADITAVKANPIIDKDRIYAVGYNGPLTAIDIRTGAKIWQKEIAASSQPWLAGRFLFVLTNDGDLAAIDKTDGKIVWTAIIPYATGEDRIGVFASGPVLANDALLIASSNGKLFSVSPYNGRIMGIADIEKGVESAPILVNETLIITTNDAEMVAYK